MSSFLPVLLTVSSLFPKKGQLLSSMIFSCFSSPVLNWPLQQTQSMHIPRRLLCWPLVFSNFVKIEVYLYCLPHGPCGRTLVPCSDPSTPALKIWWGFPGSVTHLLLPKVFPFVLGCFPQLGPPCTTYIVGILHSFWSLPGNFLGWIQSVRVCMCVCTHWESVREKAKYVGSNSHSEISPYCTSGIFYLILILIL